MPESEDHRLRELLRDVMRDELPGAIKQGVGEFMETLGVDASDAKAKIAMQQDMAFVRSLRLKVGVLATAAATGLGSGLLTAWQWAQNTFGGAAPPHHP